MVEEAIVVYESLLIPHNVIGTQPQESTTGIFT
jgi:hypothetical protein